MALVSKNDQKKRKWSEINKERKEEKRKWKEETIMKKFQTESESVNLVDSRNDEHNTEEVSTVTMAIPGSILENAQSPALCTYLAGQIGRAATIFQIDEIIIFDDYGDEVCTKKSSIEDQGGIKTIRKSCVKLGRILQYLECPQYLRKHFFPIHNDLSLSGVLNPLNAPHHLSQHDVFQYREGVVTNKPVKSGRGSIVNVGLLQDVHVDKLLPEGIRCTVKILPQKSQKKLKGIVVSPSTPRQETGVYWGYSVRLANSLAQVFSQCPFKNGYDFTIGTSDKGTSIDKFECPSYQHLLIVFGGIHGLEMALENDNALNADDPSMLFNHYLNALPNQGSKTIRTEEAVLITFAALRCKLKPQNPTKLGTKLCDTELYNKDSSKSSSKEEMTKFN